LPDLSTALLATVVGHVVNLAARNEDAHFHEGAASGALGRMGLQV
jgi:hypothetical protein